MSHPATEDALAYCARIRDLTLLHSGGWADGDALRKFQLLSNAAARAANDAESAELMRAAGEHAADLFSDTDHHKWTRGSTSGADMLRLTILGKLEAFRNRQLHLRAVARGRDAGDSDRMVYPWDE